MLVVDGPTHSLIHFSFPDPGNFFAGWQPRYFHADGHYLKYWKTEEDAKSNGEQWNPATCLAAIDLQLCEVREFLAMASLNPTGARPSGPRRKRRVQERFRFGDREEREGGTSDLACTTCSFQFLGIGHA